MVLVETVGVGQSEADVARLSEFVYLLVVTGGGDELQGIKRGLIEFADAVLVSKADGDNANAANAAASMYRTALGLFRERDSGCAPEVRTVSSLTGHGVEEAWSLAEDYRQRTQENGYWQQKRRDQLSFWLRTSLLTELQRRVSSSQVIAAELPKIEEQVRTGQLTPRSAANRILEAYIQSESTITGSPPAD